MIGVDEVGRGCWAGPMLVVAARQISELPKELTDSKMMSRAARRQIVPSLQQACQFGEGWVNAETIDAIGLSQALSLGAERALQALNALKSERIILDGTHNYIDASYTAVHTEAKADATFPIVSAASVWAKEKRDQLMIVLHDTHPNYGFNTHVGYGTEQHRKSLAVYGPLKNVHRFSFSPVASIQSS